MASGVIGAAGEGDFGGIDEAGLDRAAVLIAHRLSTVMHAHRIYVLERGKVIETGSHENLLAENGLYYAMWGQQIGVRKTFTN